MATKEHLWLIFEISPPWEGSCICFHNKETNNYTHICHFLTLFVLRGGLSQPTADILAKIGMKSENFDIFKHTGFNHFTFLIFDSLFLITMSEKCSLDIPKSNYEKNIPFPRSCLLKPRFTSLCDSISISTEPDKQV